MTDILDVRTAPAVTDTARRVNRLFLASLACFIGVVATMIVGLADRQEAQDALAERLGVPLNDIPPDQLADVIRETWTWPAYAVIALLAVVSVALFSRGVRTMGRIEEERGRSLTAAAVALPYAGVAAFLALLASERALAEEPAWLVDNWWVWTALLTAFVLCVTASLTLMVVRIRMVGLAPRAALVVLALTALVAVLAVTSGVPPILPMLLAAVFAFLRPARRRPVLAGLA